YKTYSSSRSEGSQASRHRVKALHKRQILVRRKLEILKYLLIVLISFAAAAGQAKESILISLANQQLYLYQGNKIVFSTPISSGRKSIPTPPGRYVIDMKKLVVPDPKYHMTLPYFMRLSVNPAIGIHYAHDP